MSEISTDTATARNSFMAAIEIRTPRRSRGPAPGSRPLSLDHRPEVTHLRRHVAEVRILTVEVGEERKRAVHVAGGLVRRGQVVAQGGVFVLGAAGRLEAALEPLHGELRHAFLEEADAQHARALQEA